MTRQLAKYMRLSSSVLSIRKRRGKGARRCRIEKSASSKRKGDSLGAVDTDRGWSYGKANSVVSGIV